MSVYLFIFCLEDSNSSIFLQTSTSNLDPQVVFCPPVEYIEVLNLEFAPMAVSLSIRLLRSSYSTVSFFFTMSTSLSDLAMSTRLELAAAMLPWIILQFFSMLALSLMASSSPCLASCKSRSVPALSCSAFLFVRHRVVLTDERLQIFVVQRNI